MGFKSLKGNADQILENLKNPKPVKKEQYFMFPEEKLVDGSNEVWKLLPVSDPDSDGTYWETWLHYLGGRYVACPGKVCRSTPGFPCWKGYRIHESIKELKERRRNKDILTPEEQARLDSSLQEAKDLFAKKYHFYYVVNLTPAFVNGEQTVDFCKHYEDHINNPDNPHEGHEDCPWSRNMPEGIRLFMASYGRGGTGRSKGELIQGAYSGTAKRMVSVFEVDGDKKGNVSSRLIQASRTGSGQMDTSYKFEITDDPAVIPANIMEILAAQIVPMSECVGEYTAATPDEVRDLMAAQSFDFAADNTVETTAEAENKEAPAYGFSGGPVIESPLSIEDVDESGDLASLG